MDMSNMSATDWIIRLSIFGVLAIAVVGTFQNIVDAIKEAGKGRQAKT